MLQATSTAAVTPVTGVVLYDVSDLVGQVRPGVVSVTETGMTMDMFMGRVETEGEGTGIVIDDQGHILTNYHVISGAETVSVYAEDGRERSARVIFGDPATDIAILEVEDTEGLVPLVLGDSDAMEVGDPVIAMGNALGLDETSPTVSVGIVSALGRTIETDQAVLEDLIQTDAAINAGNSGGPLLNAAGEVIGINTAIASGAENIGFSISVNSVIGGDRPGPLRGRGPLRRGHHHRQQRGTGRPLPAGDGGGPHRHLGAAHRPGRRSRGRGRRHHPRRGRGGGHLERSAGCGGRAGRGRRDPDLHHSAGPLQTATWR